MGGNGINQKTFLITILVVVIVGCAADAGVFFLSHTQTPQITNTVMNSTNHSANGTNSSNNSSTSNQGSSSGSNSSGNTASSGKSVISQQQALDIGKQNIPTGEQAVYYTISYYSGVNPYTNQQYETPHYLVDAFRQSGSGGCVGYAEIDPYTGAVLTVQSNL